MCLLLMALRAKPVWYGERKAAGDSHGMRKDVGSYWTNHSEGRVEGVKLIPKSLSVAPNVLRRILFLIAASQFHFAPSE